MPEEGPEASPSHSHDHGHSHAQDGHNHAHGEACTHDEPQDAPVRPAEVDLTDGEEGWKNPLGSGSLIIKTMVSPKEKSHRPEMQQQVTLEMKGWVRKTKDLIVDEKVTCYIGDETLVPGVELALRMMGKGEVALVRMSSRFAYMSNGLPPEKTLSKKGVPADAEVAFRLHLQDIGEFMPEAGKMNPRQRIEFGSKKKAKGNAKYKEEKFQYAQKAYEEALKCVGESKDWKGADADLLKQLKALKIDCENNLCAALLGQKSYAKAEGAARRALEVDGDNVKALVRLTRILLAGNRLGEAAKTIKKIKSVDPSNQRVSKFQQTLAEKKVAEKKRKENFARKFQKEFLGDSGHAKPESARVDDEGDDKGNPTSSNAESQGRCLYAIAATIPVVIAAALGVYVYAQ